MDDPKDGEAPTLMLPPSPILGLTVVALVEARSTCSKPGEPAFCGLGTLAMVMNALGVDPKRVWKGPWRWFSESLLDCCEPLDVVKERGITFSKVACLARCNGAHVEAHRCDEEMDDGLAHFRAQVTKTSAADPEDEKFQVLIVSYSRKAFGQTGDGHYSPIGGYHAKTDQVLILDVARFKYPPHWVPLTTLWDAMSRVDSETGRSRGYMILRSNAALSASRMALVWRWPECSEDAKNSVSTISGCRKAFSEALLSEPLPGNTDTENAAEILRRTLRVPEKIFCGGCDVVLLALELYQGFIASPQMPLRVLCKMPETPGGGPEVIEEMRDLAKALAEFAQKVNVALGDECFQIEDINPKAIEELKCPNLPVAAVLAIEPLVWEQVLCPEGPTREARAKGAWEVLKSLLSDVPEMLRKEVHVLQSQWADLLTAREEMCRGLSGCGCERPQCRP